MEDAFSIKFKEVKNKYVPFTFPELKFCKRISYEMILLPYGKIKYLDEQRYGGNGALAMDREKGLCQICGSDKNVIIHHNNGFSNELEDLVICCRSCHRRIHIGKE